ncbi:MULTISPECIES: glycosyltransferase family 2 protein [unclassified Microbacterium]|uniref:glycosyltransferase family 2 protein n=1 Tax=unclassified Microbacterium TaxID=2609290 RepID=UPI00037F2746|nr:glycosyltransferase family A protein [Microbacterium sp. 77mftsu3.1]SDG38310.1 Glycosyltransferase involved in cell wall bisynthesis [Microbacterium sp. 77mftsu3.1]
MIKVSVVVPTYKTSVEGLARLVGSLERQTMPASEFEVIFVDDGSPDDTLQRLRKLAETHSNVRVEAIENSGWPSKPRNVGIELAQGEYIAFMDHDDELYPDALRAAYEFGVANNADAVNGKEARTTSASWGMGTYDEDRPQSIGRTDVHPLIPMNPHKMYRRAFLNEHGIRFIEGARVLWEDIFFNVLVSRHARVISTLTSVPYYHWVTTKGSGSSTFVKHGEDFWRWLPRVCQSIIDELPGEENRLQREQLELHQYGNRLVGVFDSKYVTRTPKQRRFMFEQAQKLQRDFDFARLEGRMNSSKRVRAELLRADRQDLLEEICVSDAAVPGWARATTVEWRGGILHVSSDVTWADSKGTVPALVRDGDRIRKGLPTEVRDLVSAEATDMTADVDGITVSGLVRSRRSRIAWALPLESDVRVEDLPDGTVRVSATASFTVDPAAAASGAPLEEATHWDLHVHARFGNSSTDRPLKSTIPASVTLTDGRLHLVYPNDSTNATIIPGGQREAVRRLTPESAALVDGDLVLELAGHHDGAGEVETVVGVWAAGASKLSDRPARLRIADGAAQLIVPGVGAGTIDVRVGDRAPGGPGAWTVRADKDRRILERSSRPSTDSTPASKPAPAPTPTPTLRRTVGRVLRRFGLR